MKFLNSKIKKRKAPSIIRLYKGLGYGELSGSRILLPPLFSSHLHSFVVQDEACHPTTGAKPPYDCQYPLVLERIEDSGSSEQNEAKGIQYEQCLHHCFTSFSRL